MRTEIARVKFMTSTCPIILTLCVHDICHVCTLFVTQVEARRQGEVVPRSSPAQRGTMRNAAGTPDRRLRTGDSELFGKASQTTNMSVRLDIHIYANTSFISDKSFAVRSTGYL
jgi:hypothetical protein